MYTLSRLLPDGTERPIVANPPGRAGGEDEPACCEFLPGEIVSVQATPAVDEEGFGPTLIAVLSLDAQGRLLVTPGRRDCTVDLSVKPLGSGELSLVVFDGGRPVATLRYLDDVRVFIQVYPHTVPEAPVPAA